MKHAVKPIVDLIRNCAAHGMTRQQTADELGMKILAVGRYGRLHKIEFVHASAGRGVDADRAEAMAAMYRGGKTLEEIGSVYGITRERVRQVIKKEFGLVGCDGGKSKRAQVASQARQAKREALCLERYGCTDKQHRELKAIGREMLDSGESRERTPIGAFNSQRCNARGRNIEWNLTLWEWWSVWQDSGHWSERGRGRGYMMCRFSDSGPYEIGNVYIATGIHNSKIQPNNPYRRTHPDFDEVMAARAKRNGRSNLTCSEPGCDNKHYGHGLCQKHYCSERYTRLKKEAAAA